MSENAKPEGRPFPIKTTRRSAKDSSRSDAASAPEDQGAAVEAQELPPAGDTARTGSGDAATPKEHTKAKSRGSRGSKGSATPKAAEKQEHAADDCWNPLSGGTGSKGSAPSKAADALESPAHVPDGPSRTSEFSDPFAPLHNRLSPANDDAKPAEALDEIEVLVCPEEKPPLRRFQHFRLGDPSRVWIYRDAAGMPLAVAARYDYARDDGSPGKDVLPWVYGNRNRTDPKGCRHVKTGWHNKAPPEPRPLYGLDRLAMRPDAPVLITEGEKAADAAEVLFPDLVAVTSQGGSKAPRKTDWTPLADRSIAIWPDQDDAGASYAEAVATLLKQAGASSVRIVDVPTDWPDGWDLADPLPDGVTVQQLREMLDDAPDGAPVVMPAGFRMTSRGLVFFPAPKENGGETDPLWISAPFRVVGETRTDVSDGWGLMLKWRDREGAPHQWAIPRRLIHRPGNEIAEELEHNGLSCGITSSAHQLLKSFVGDVRAPRLLRCVSRSGWHAAVAGSVFVMPSGDAFGRGASDVVLQHEAATANIAFRATGTLAGWQTQVAALAVGNDRMALFMSAAFAGTLLDLLGEPSGGFHLVGDSRTGKSTAAMLAGSVWGKPSSDAQLRPWRGTANGLEGVAAETSDALLILDEMGQADAREVGDVIYMLANEAGKQRSTRTGAPRRRQTWRTIFLSTGELTLAAKMGEAGKKAAAGLDVRLINLPADAGMGLGAFQNLHGRPSSAVLVDELRQAALSHYGHAARAFLARFAADRGEDAAALKIGLDSLRADFLAMNVPPNSTGQIRSVAGRFALVAVAGEIACGYGVLPWPPGEATRAAAACFRVWLGERVGNGPAETTAAIAQVRQFLETHGEARFTPLTRGAEGGAPEPTRTIARAGFRRRIGIGDEERWEYLILSETWKSEVCRGLDAKRVADLLLARGWLVGATDRHRSASVNIPGEGKRRVYIVSGAILAGDNEEDEHGAG